MSSDVELARSNPEAQGMSSQAVLDFVLALEQHSHPLDAAHGFILLRHGNVAAEGWWKPYQPALPHTLYSLSKSFTSTAIGLAVNERRLSVDDLVLPFFPDDALPAPDENLKAMRVRHLLSMNTGHHADTSERVFFGEVKGPRAFLSLPVEHRPGEWFVYNTAATYMLSCIITNLTGQSLLDYLRPRLFEPLGIAHPTWEADPRGVSIGGSGLHITTEDIARFGQMYLQKGMWRGRRIVPDAWIAEATRAHSDNSNTQTNPDWTAGYGYQFWRCRPGCYRGDGAFGQFCIVMPEQDAVLAITSGVRDMQAVLDKVWQHLLPAMQPLPLPPNATAWGALQDKLASLSLPIVQGRKTAPAAQRAPATYRLEKNDLQMDTIAIKHGRDKSVLIAGNEHGEHRIATGHGHWLSATTGLRGNGDESVAACGAWTADGEYEARICFTESEVGLVLRFLRTDGLLELEIEPNVSWGPTTASRITGRPID